MAKKTNLKADKAKRNKEYALRFKKRRSSGRPRYAPEGQPAGSEGAPGAFAPRPRSTPQFSAVCSGCGQEAKLPFEPTSGKPVYCDSCFQKQR